MILAIRSDKPEAELYLYDGDRCIDKQLWQAHRQLSDTLLEKIEQLLKRNNATAKNIKGVVVFKGPGSFTGLRIGTTVANTLAYSLDLPIVATTGKDWVKAGLAEISRANSRPVLPEYGAEAHITKPRK